MSVIDEYALTDRPLFVGAHVSRVEDDRLLRGEGRYIADMRFSEMVEMAIVRSPLAHAQIRSIDMRQAENLPGIVAVISGEGLAGISPFPDTNAYARPVNAFPLATGRVRYAGAPVVAIVAENRYLAEDAVELVNVDYEELPVVASVEQALAGDTLLYEEWEDNHVMHIPVNVPPVDELFAASPRVVRGRYSVHRHTAMPIETRGCLAVFEQSRLTLWTSTQSPHFVRKILSEMLSLPESDIRIVAPDVGGSFGCKCHLYSEEVLSCWLAMRIGRPVRFIEDRLEHMIATNHAREQTFDIEAAVSEDGQILAVRSQITADVGSGEIWYPGIGPSAVAAGTLPGPYRIPDSYSSISCVVTNKTPSGAYRGYGAPEGVFALESLVDKIARDIGVDRIELRRRMLLTDDDLPFTTAGGSVYDSGSYRKAFDRTVEIAQVAYEDALREVEGDHRVRIGLGFATYVEGTAPSGFTNTGMWGAHESSVVRVEPDGTVVVSVGVTTQGQGVTSMVATLTADALGVPIDRVRVEMGDTDLCPMGQGGWGSRSTIMAGGATLTAAARVRQKLLAIASHMLESSVEDLTIQDGRVEVKGTDRSIGINEIADAALIRTFRLPAGMEGGLEATAVYVPPNVDHWPNEVGQWNPCPTYANASHAAVVRVYLDTGETRVLQYVATHDCGRLINPVIVDGQVQGGIAQGVGGALLEHLVYSPEAQLLTASFMDYLLPTSMDVPPMIVEHFESPSPSMPLGVKGVGEGGVIGVLAAISNAVAHALAEFDVEIFETPLTPSRVRELIRNSTAGVSTPTEAVE